MKQIVERLFSRLRGLSSKEGAPDGRSLAQPQVSRGSPGKEALETSAGLPAEEVLLRMWEKALKTAPIGVHDDFTFLGGNMDLALELSHAIRELFYVDLPLKAFFQNPTVSGLVHLLSLAWEGQETVDEIAWTFLEIERSSDERILRELREPFDVGFEGSRS